MSAEYQNDGVSVEFSIEGGQLTIGAGVAGTRSWDSSYTEASIPLDDALVILHEATGMVLKAMRERES